MPDSEISFLHVKGAETAPLQSSASSPILFPNPSLSFSDPSIIYCQTLPVKIFSYAHEDLCNELTIQLQTLHQTRTGRQTFKIEVTHPTNPFFFYCLEVGEAEFRTIRTEQKLLIDFYTFPSKLIELLDACLSHYGNLPRLTPTFTLGPKQPISAFRYATGTAPTFTTQELNTLFPEATFCLIEANEFKELTHISLKLQHGNDDAIRQHLFKRIKEAQVENEQLKITNASLESSNEVLVRKYSEANLLIQSLEKNRNFFDLELKNKLNNEASQSKALAEEQSQAITELRQQILELQNAEIQYQKELKELRSSPLQKDYESQSQKLTQLTDTCSFTEKQNEDLKKKLEERNQTINTLEQKLHTNDKTQSDATSFLTNLQLQKESAFSAVAAYKEQNMKLEEELKNAVKEINKGNIIISKLQTHFKSQKLKCKALASENQQSEQIISDLSSALEEKKEHTLQLYSKSNFLEQSEVHLKEEIASLKQQLETYTEEISSLKESNASLLKQLNELHLEAFLNKYPSKEVDGNTPAATPRGDSVSNSRSFANNQNVPVNYSPSLPPRQSNEFSPRTHRLRQSGANLSPKQSIKAPMTPKSSSEKNFTTPRRSVTSSISNKPSSGLYDSPRSPFGHSVESQPINEVDNFASPFQKNLIQRYNKQITEETTDTMEINAFQSTSSRRSSADLVSRESVTSNLKPIRPTAVKSLNQDYINWKP